MNTAAKKLMPKEYDFNVNMGKLIANAAGAISGGKLPSRRFLAAKPGSDGIFDLGGVAASSNPSSKNSGTPSSGGGSGSGGGGGSGGGTAGTGGGTAGTGGGPTTNCTGVNAHAAGCGGMGAGWILLIVVLCFTIPTTIIFVVLRKKHMAAGDTSVEYTNMDGHEAPSNTYVASVPGVTELASPLLSVSEQDLSIQQQKLLLFLNQQELEELFDRLKEDGIQCIDELEHVSVDDLMRYGLNEAAAKDAMKKIKLYKV